MVHAAILPAPAAVPAAAATARASRSLLYDRAVSQLRGVITDWGGVMTNPISETVSAWLEADRIDRASYVTVMREWVKQAYADGQDRNPIHALERGECTNAEFELALASRLVLADGGPVAGPGLLARMFAGSALDRRDAGPVPHAAWRRRADLRCCPTPGAASIRGICSRTCSMPW